MYVYMLYTLLDWKYHYYTVAADNRYQDMESLNEIIILHC